MSAVDDVDHTFNTTSIASTGIFEVTKDQFFCQLTKRDVRCLNSTQFANQPFHELCPSGNCLTDCQDLKRLYTPLPDKITFTNQSAYGTPPNVTLWPLCAGLANISLAIAKEIPPLEDLRKFEQYFANPNETDYLAVAAASVQCWSDTCAHSRNPEICTRQCAPVNLLQSRTNPQLAGTRECIKATCPKIDGLPFANQDIIGVGVSSSYVIQSFLMLLCWVALASNSFIARRRNRHSPAHRSSESRDSILQGISGFHTAQCFFSIPLAIAALHGNPFTTDPLNGFGLLPVSTNGFLPQIFSLTILFFNITPSWYLWFLTIVSYLLNSVIFWAVINYLNSIRGKGTALGAPAYHSLGGIESCGGLTGIGLCLQFQDDSPPAFLIQQIGSATWTSIRAAPWIWAWSTSVLLVLTVLKIYSTEIGRKLLRQLPGPRTSPSIVTIQRYLHHVSQGFAAYSLVSAIFLACLIYQNVMFFTCIRLGLIDLRTWTFGQIVAVAVWIPPVMDYLHLQTDVVLAKMYQRRAWRVSGMEQNIPLSSYERVRDQEVAKKEPEL
ncbi:MAG: hypothetical protein M1836_004132 [Candelina mexicana]|nr:MAG: hypothetical protein M1836_004132 [Candelina mexicana]